jgi:hypothetical protein
MNDLKFSRALQLFIYTNRFGQVTELYCKACQTVPITDVISPEIMDGKFDKGSCRVRFWTVG